MLNNSAGVAGFIFACMAVCFGWVPFLGGFLWLLGVVFSLAGLANDHRTMAWAGLAVSFGWIIAFFILGLLFNTFAALTLYPYYLWW